MFAAPRYSSQLVPVAADPVRVDNRIAVAPAPVPSDPPRLSNSKLVVLGASIGLIFLLGKLGKK